MDQNRVFKRSWINLRNAESKPNVEKTSSEMNHMKEKTNFEFVVMSYNTLSQGSIRRSVYSYCSDKAIKWASRSKSLVEEISQSKSDIICLQEIDADKYENFWKPSMKKCGYETFFSCKKRNGCLIGYNVERFDMVSYQEVLLSDISKGTSDTEMEELHKDNTAQLLALKPKSQEGRQIEGGIVVGNTHLFWNFVYYWTRLLQAKYYVESAIELSRKLGFAPILCGKN